MLLAFPSDAQDPSRKIAIEIDGKAIYPHAAGQSWRDVFIETMTDALAEKGLEPVWIEAGTSLKPGSADMYLVLYPQQFGFRMVDTTGRMMAASVEFDAAYSSQPISGEHKPAKEPLYLTDKSQVSYDQFVESGNARSSLTRTPGLRPSADRAGRSGI